MCGADYQNRHAIADALQNGAIVILGEVHDNPAAHGVRGALVANDFAGRGLHPAAVFEHIRDDQRPALATFSAINKSVPAGADVSDLMRLLDWDKSGWPDQAIFQPLFEAVIRAKLPIYAGDPARETIKKVAKEGEGALPADERASLKLDVALPAAAQEGLLEQLEESHCGLMPKTAFGKLAYAQRYRDAHLADAVLKAATKQGSAILFAGNGHVRADRGVPWYISQRAPDKKIVTVMLLEVEDGKIDPEAYVERELQRQAARRLHHFHAAAGSP